MDTLSRLWRRAPWWLSLALGLICLAIGASLTLRPFASLAVLIVLSALALLATGANEVAAADPAGDRRLDVLAGLGWIVAGLAVLLWPGLTLRGLVVVLGVGMVIGGALKIIGGLRGTADERFAALIGGVASVILGLLALSWPDVTVLIVAVLFGLRTATFGLAQIVSSLRRARGGGESREGEGSGVLRRWSRALGALLALLVALALLGISTTLHRGAPRPDAFYDAPATVPPTPGALLRSEPFTRAIPAGARAWRILYTTTRDDRTPALASAIVVAAAAPPAGPRPVIAWAHGTTGADRSCAPSLLKDPFTAGATPALDQIIANGWVLVATDYVGLGTAGPHPYLIGQGEGRSVLDAVRAARQLAGLTLADQTVVWGHSQGGHAALWAGILAPRYAPDANVIGVAALAPASNLVGLINNLENVAGGEIFASFVISAYDAAYPDADLDTYIRPAARLVVREMASRCLAEPEVFVSIVSTLTFDRPIWSTDPGTGPFAARLAENIPSGPIPAPLLIAQGESDGLVLPSAQAEFVKQRCAAGQALEYRTYPGRDHVPLIEADSPLIPDLIRWTRDRLAGNPATPTC